MTTSDPPVSLRGFSPIMQEMLPHIEKYFSVFYHESDGGKHVVMLSPKYGDQVRTYHAHARSLEEALMRALKKVV